MLNIIGFILAVGGIGVALTAFVSHIIRTAEHDTNDTKKNYYDSSTTSYLPR